MLLKMILITVVLLGLAFLGLGIQIFFSKRRKFPEYEVGHNREMAKRKIRCMKAEQVLIDKKLKDSGGPEGICTSCSSFSDC